MNPFKRFLMSFLALWLALASLAGAWNGALAAGNDHSASVSVELVGSEAADIWLKRGGVFMESSAYNGMLTLTRQPASQLVLENFRLRAQDLSLHRTFLQFEVENFNGRQVKRLYGLVYVYFNLTRAERRLWDAGKLAIYQYDAYEREWVECLANRYVTRSVQGRVACLATQTGLYALAEDVS
jgi:hypothetical protein